jgi:hypothetical protein
MNLKTREALLRLRLNPDFKEFLAHLETSRDTANSQLINATGNDIFVCQGRTQAYLHILGEIRNVEKQTSA